MKLKISIFLRPRKHQNHRFHLGLIAFLKSVICMKSSSGRLQQIHLLSRRKTRIPLHTRVLQHNPAVAARILRRPGHAHPHTRAPSVRQALAANHRRHVRTTTLRPSLQPFCFRSTQRTTCLRLFQAAAAEWAKPNEIRRGYSPKHPKERESPYGV